MESKQESTKNFYEHNINSTGMHTERALPLEWLCYYPCKQSCFSVTELASQLKKNDMEEGTQRETLLIREEAILVQQKHEELEVKDAVSFKERFAP